MFSVEVVVDDDDDADLDSMVLLLLLLLLLSGGSASLSLISSTDNRSIPWIPSSFSTTSVVVVVAVLVLVLSKLPVLDAYSGLIYLTIAGDPTAVAPKEIDGYDR